jgi:hypothetical protein
VSKALVASTYLNYHIWSPDPMELFWIRAVGTFVSDVLAAALYARFA